MYIKFSVASARVIVGKGVTRGINSGGKTRVGGGVISGNIVAVNVNTKGLPNVAEEEIKGNGV